VLNAIYEQEFLGFSYGFRPGRRPHDALDALAVALERKKVNWVLDADIRDFFTQLDQGWLERFLEHPIADKRILRLIQRWLRAGVIENGEWLETEAATAQGASSTPTAEAALVREEKAFSQIGQSVEGPFRVVRDPFQRFRKGKNHACAYLQEGSSSGRTIASAEKPFEVG
jgi:hypothetical protein